MCVNGPIKVHNEPQHIRVFFARFSVHGVPHTTADICLLFCKRKMTISIKEIDLKLNFGIRKLYQQYIKKRFLGMMSSDSTAHVFDSVIYLSLRLFAHLDIRLVDIIAIIERKSPF